MAIIDDWAKTWGVPPAAIDDLRARMGAHAAPPAEPVMHHGEAASESYVQSAVRLEAAKKDVILWRNNVGALKDKTGRLIRYGLCNESEQQNAAYKSADLIGIRRRVITLWDVGQTIGQFVGREVKEAEWHYSGKGREVSQLAWATLANSYGADVKFANGPGSF